MYFVGLRLAVVKIDLLSLVHFPVEPKNLFEPSLLTPLLHLTYGTGAMNDKDLAVSSDHANTCLYTHPGCHGRTVFYNGD